MYSDYSEAIEAYDEMMNEVTEPTKIGYLEFYASDIVRQLDPIAYRVGFYDWLDAEGIDSDDLDEYGSDQLP